MASEKTGTVVSSGGGLYSVRCEDESVVTCKPRGKFRHEKIRLLVGDKVNIAQDENGNPVVDGILPRKNVLIRPAMANLDLLMIVVAAKDPDPILMNVDKLTVVAQQNEVTPVIVVTKADLDLQRAKEIASIYRLVGYRVFITGMQIGPEDGAFALGKAFQEEYKDLVCAFAGASGVGKSTLMNRLFPTLRLQTGEVSRKLGRGKHTTRSVDLFAFQDLSGKGSGFLADTPGFSLLDFENFDFCTLEQLPFDFIEFSPCLGRCRYSKCTHRKEEGCLILEKVRDGEIPISRLESYTLLYEQLKNKRKY